MKTILENLNKLIDQQIELLREQDESLAVKPEKIESIYDAKIGNTIIIQFENVTLKLERISNNIFRVIDATESQHLESGDLLTLRGNDILEPGKELHFDIFRKINNPYDSNKIQSWRIVKN